MKNMVDILKALSDETRLRIINLLYVKELCVCDIVETLSLSQTKVSRHLQNLKNAGLVEDRKHAQWAYYSMIQNKEFRFLDSLIHDNLRTLEPFISDLFNLEKWLKNKNAG
ncbi:MAG: metalloregulator ArsR/SmtB family transcription factor [Clostridia bacterium]|nr:metalloregulator ArsR/SmtB family transcription factor [Clostridia bacterium]